MKRFFLPLLSFVLVISVLLTSAGNVSAMPVKDGSANPSVSWVSGDKVYTVDNIALVNLPGTTTTGSGMIVPAGFSIKGEKQFEGVGIKVSGFDSGKLNACFPITAVTQGWSGKVGRWNGSKWELLSTKIATSKESVYSLACANLTSNGVYALIKWVSDPEKLTSNKGNCNYQILNTYGTEVDWSSSTGDTYNYSVFDDYWMVRSDTNLDGMSVTITLIASSPANSYRLSPSSFSGTLYSNGGNYYRLEPITIINWESDIYPYPVTATYRFDFGNCYQDFVKYFK